MAIEVLLLALAGTLGPTTLAAVSTLLARESRRRLLFAYVICGFAFTMLFGMLVVGVFHGIHTQPKNNETHAAADIAGGVAALLLGLGVLTGVVGRRPKDATAKTGGTWAARLDQGVTVRVAALAGLVTHLPGLSYLIALNAIVAANPELPGGTVAVATYNGVWFAVPIAALILCSTNPDGAQRAIAALAEAATRHSRSILLVTCFVVGTALIVRGALAG